MSLQHLLMAFTLAAFAFSVSALPQGTETAKSPEIERLDPSVKSIEGESLPFNSHAPRLIASIPSEVSEVELTNPYVDDYGINSSTVIGRLRGKPGFSAEALVKEVNAIRILAFMTQPGETITFDLKSEQSKVRMAVYSDPKATKMRAAVKRANMPPATARSRKLVFINTTKEPYEMLLFVYGLHGYQYQLNWESKLKK